MADTNSATVGTRRRLSTSPSVMLPDHGVADDIATVCNKLFACLKDDLYVSDIGLVDGLIEDGYLSSGDWEAIKNVHRNKKKVKILIKSLAKSSCPLKAFESFLRKLQISHGHLIPKVEDILIRYGITRDQLTAIEDENANGVNSESISIKTNNVLFSHISRNIEKQTISAEINDNNNERIATENEQRQWNCQPSCDRGGLENDKDVEYKQTDETVLWSECKKVATATESHGYLQSSCAKKIYKSQELNFPFSQANHTTSNEREPVESSWREDSNNQYNQLITDREYLNQPHHLDMNDTEDDAIELNNRSVTEHSFYGFDEVDAISFDMNSSLDQIQNQKRSKESVENSDRFNELQRIRSNCPVTVRPIVESHRQYPHFAANDVSPFDEHVVDVSDCFTKCSMCQYNYTPVSHGSTVEHVFLSKLDLSSSSSQANTVCENCRRLQSHENSCELRARGVSSPIENHRKTNSRTRIESTILSSSSSSDSEINTDIDTSDLNDEERIMFTNNMKHDGDISDIVDGYIEAGYLSYDDYNLIHNTSSHRRKMSILVRLISNSGQRCADQIQSPFVDQNHHDEYLSFVGPNYKQRRFDADATSNDVVSASHMRCLLASDEVDSSAPKAVGIHAAIEILPPLEKVFINKLDDVFDKLNIMLNKGTLKVDTLPDNPNIQCMVYYLQACDNLYLHELDAAENFIKKADSVLLSTDYPSHLRSEIFTAKTWLCLVTNKLGKMLQLLEENEQYIKSAPGNWPAKAKGWFYYDYSRCYSALIAQALFRGKTTKDKLVQHYRQSAITCTARAVDYFRSSQSSDGPIGSGFAWCKQVELYLLYLNKTPAHEIQVSDEDIAKAKYAIECVKNLPGGIPEVLRTSYLLCKARYCIRTGDLKKAADIVTGSLELSRGLNLKFETEDGLFLQSHLAILRDEQNRVRPLKAKSGYQKLKLNCYG